MKKVIVFLSLVLIATTSFAQPKAQSELLIKSGDQVLVKAEPCLENAPAGFIQKTYKTTVDQTQIQIPRWSRLPQARTFPAARPVETISNSFNTNINIYPAPTVAANNWASTWDGWDWLLALLFLGLLAALIFLIISMINRNNNSQPPTQPAPATATATVHVHNHGPANPPANNASSTVPPAVQSSINAAATSGGTITFGKDGTCIVTFPEKKAEEKDKTQ